MKRYLWLVMAASVIAGAWAVYWYVTLPGHLFGPQDLTWIRAQTNRDLYVGTDPSYPPFAEYTPEQVIGIEADIAREIGQRLDLTTYVQIMGPDSLYDSLYTGNVDMVIAGLRVNPRYDGWVYYSDPYFDAGQILVSRADAPVGDMRALDGRSVAVELASSGDQAAQRWIRRLHALTIKRYFLPDEAMRAVQQGQADAALVDTVSARLYLDNHSNLVMADSTTAPEPYRIAMREDNFELTRAVERILDEMIADGTLDAIIARWL